MPEIPNWALCSRKLEARGLPPKAPGLLSLQPGGERDRVTVHVDDVQQEDFELASTVFKFRRDGLSTPAPMQSRELELSQA